MSISENVFGKHKWLCTYLHTYMPTQILTVVWKLCLIWRVYINATDDDSGYKYDSLLLERVRRSQIQTNRLRCEIFISFSLGGNAWRTDYTLIPSLLIHMKYRNGFFALCMVNEFRGIRRSLYVTHNGHRNMKHKSDARGIIHYELMNNTYAGPSGRAV